MDETLMVTVCIVLFGNIIISRRFCRCIAVDDSTESGSEAGS